MIFHKFSDAYVVVVTQQDFLRHVLHHAFTVHEHSSTVLSGNLGKRIFCIDLEELLAMRNRLVGCKVYVLFDEIDQVLKDKVLQIDNINGSQQIYYKPLILSTVKWFYGLSGTIDDAAVTIFSAGCDAKLRIMDVDPVKDAP